MGERSWSQEPHWGIWRVPETRLQLLPDDMAELDAIELGCGTGYVSAWMARRGASVVGIDMSVHQLETARRLATEHEVDLKLIHGNAERLPHPDASFDFAISEYGAAIWADPYKWIPEVHRVLRPGGTLAFLGNHPFLHCTQPRNLDIPATTTLVEPYFGLHRIDWDIENDHSTTFNLTLSGWIRLFLATGFDILRYHELRAPSDGGVDHDHVTALWARDFPSEQIWQLRKRGHSRWAS